MHILINFSFLFKPHMNQCDRLNWRKVGIDVLLEVKILLFVSWVISSFKRLDIMTFKSSK